MKKLFLAALVALPLVGGCYAEAYPYGRPVYARRYYRPYYYGPRVYVAPPRVYW